MTERRPERQRGTAEQTPPPPGSGTPPPPPDDVSADLDVSSGAAHTDPGVSADPELDPLHAITPRPVTPARGPAGDVGPRLDASSGEVDTFLGFEDEAALPRTPAPGTPPGDSGTPLSPGSVGDDRALALQSATVVAGRYDVRERLGVGGMGAVYRVYDRERSREVALKVMLPSLLRRPRAVERFRDEAELMLQLSHGGIVRVHDVGSDSRAGLRFYTMELLTGCTLRAWVEQRKAAKRPLTLAETCALVRQILDAVRYAHGMQVLHRDLKPENIFAVPATEVSATLDFTSADADTAASGAPPAPRPPSAPSDLPRLKILDFGIARLQTRGHVTSTGTPLGTPDYISPEQKEGRRVDQRTDLYSIAMIFYELLCGQKALGHFRRPSEVRRDVPKRVDAVILRGLHSQAEDRYQDADAFLRDVDALMRPARPWRIVAAAAAVLFGLAGLGAWWQPWSAASSSSASTPSDTDGTNEKVVEGVPVGDASIAVTSPEDRAVSLVAVVAVRGIVQGAAGVRATADDDSHAMLVPEADGSFEGTIALRDGARVLKIEAVDAKAATLASVVRHVTVDTKPPVLQLDRLPPFVNVSELVVAGRTEPEAKVVLGRASMTADAQGSFRFLHRLVEGPNAFEVVATDAAGQSNREHRSVALDSVRPTITLGAIDSPWRGGPEVEIAGEVSEDGCTVDVDGRAAEVSSRTFKSIVTLAAARNEVRFAARDRAGNAAVECKREVLYEPRGWSDEALPPNMRRGAQAPIVVWNTGEKYAESETAVEIEMVYVAPGTFRMGSDGAPNEAPVHEHRIETGFWIARTEVTWRQYRAFCESTKRTPVPVPTEWKLADTDLLDHPVVNVSWDDARAFCEWAKLVLPSEAQWELAARGPKSASGATPKGRFPWGDEWTPRATNVSDSDDVFTFTAPVGSFAEGDLTWCGAVDMLGNVSEWCRDGYERDAYARYSKGDFAPPARGEQRVYRGGNWRLQSRWLRLTMRTPSPPTGDKSRQPYVGFRPIKEG